MLTQTYVLTAEHCIWHVDKNEGIDRWIANCLDNTAVNKSTVNTFTGETSFCYNLESKDIDGSTITSLEIVPAIGSKGKVWLGVNNYRDLEDVQSRTIQRIIRHPRGYRNGGYRDYGGYDISIVEVDKPFETDKFGCLPSPNYDDTNGPSIIIGYGNFFRHSCLTNRLGPAKFHYCKGNTECKTTEHPKQDGCSSFFEKHSISHNYDEAMIIEDDKDPIFCFKDSNSESLQFGWCETDKNLYNLEGAPESESWGFCSRDCYLDKQNHESGVLRIVDNVTVSFMYRIIK